MSIESIRARVEKATAGPWCAWWQYGLEHPVVGVPMENAFAVGMNGGWLNASFAAHARADIPALLRVAEALGEAIESNPWGLREADYTDIMAALAELEQMT